MNDEYMSSQVDSINQAAWEIRDLIKEFPRPTLHDRFAMAALTGLLANSDPLSTWQKWPDGPVESAFVIADECMKRREKKA